MEELLYRSNYVVFLIFVDDDKIILKKYNPADIFTGEDMDDLIDYKGKKVSRKSIIELAKLAGFEITEA